MKSLNSKDASVNPSTAHDRRQALVAEFRSVNAELERLRLRARRLHDELSALKNGGGGNSTTDSKFNTAQQKLEALRKRKAG